MSYVNLGIWKKNMQISMVCKSSSATMCKIQYPINRLFMLHKFRGGFLKSIGGGGVSKIGLLNLTPPPPSPGEWNQKSRFTHPAECTRTDGWVGWGWGGWRGWASEERGGFWKLYTRFPLITPTTNRLSMIQLISVLYT